jgi:hypothetical protein
MARILVFRSVPCEFAFDGFSFIPQRLQLSLGHLK